MTALERAIERPVSTTFFPTARIAFVLGTLIAFAGVAWKRDKDSRVEVLVEPETQVAVDVADVARPDVPISFPLRGPAVVHVWLENCADCMTAFAAHKLLVERGDLAKLPQINVSYGGSSPEFRERFGVDKNYVADLDGSQVVRPNGIGSFTTLVIDKTGVVVHRDRPDRDGYVNRVWTAYAKVVADEKSRER